MMNVVCTIVSASYLPQAVVLAKSTQEFNPTLDIVVLITDLNHENFPSLPGVVLLSAADLDLEPSRLDEMRNYYDVVEFATSLKPSLIKKLLNSGYEIVTFLDPDILVMASLESVHENVKSYGSVFTPHRISPIKSHKTLYAEKAFLQYGVLNLGFCSFNQSGIALLDWWEEHLRWDATRLPNSPVFTDQKWANLFVTYFDIYIDKDPGLNLAPWNLDERFLEFKDQALFSGNSNLKFIHFSQMSGELVKGHDPGLWQSMGNGTSSFAASMIIINEITNSYIKKLSEARKTTQKFEIPGTKTQLGRWERLVLREESRANIQGTKNELSKILGWFCSFKIIDKTDFIFAIILELNQISQKKDKFKRIFEKLFKSS